MSTQPSPATFAFVTGHEFGEATFRAILGLPEYGTKLRCSLLALLDQAKSSVTVGYTDLGPFAAKSGVPVEYIRSIKTEAAQNLLRESAPDYLMIVGWSELAPSAILDIPKSKHRGVARHTASYGCIGMHQTLLPEGRGRAPIPWAIIKGLNRTGVTTFLLEEAADAGGIVDQIQIPIDATETATTFLTRHEWPTSSWAHAWERGWLHARCPGLTRMNAWPRPGRAVGPRMAGLISLGRPSR